MFAPGQTEIFEIAVRTGIGLMVTLKVMGVPEQPFKFGATIKEPTILFEVVLLGAIQGEIFPIPEPLTPIAVFVFCQ